MRKNSTAVVAAVTALGVSWPGAGLGGTANATEHDRRSPVHATSIPVGPADDGTRLRTGRMTTAPYEMAAVTWRGGATPEVHLRARSGGAWGRWRELEPLDTHAPDARTREAAGGTEVSGTELLWIGRSDGVQVRVDGRTGRRTRVVLVDPGSLPSDLSASSGTPSAPPGERSADPTDAPQPAIHSRGEWGADESWRDGSPVYNGTIKQAHVHHTAGTNVYSRSDVPAIIRGDYWYHTQVLGWSDLGYNFVVDRFGRVWEGRAGGVDMPVRGAHTLGFNHASFGVAALGNFDEFRPSPELVDALVRLSAWKLDAYDRQPAGYTWVTSKGSDRYPAGTRVRLPVIDGHRDTNETACPGEHLYAELPDIRRRAQQRADMLHAGGATPG